MMKSTIVLIAFVGGLNQCGMPAIPNKIAQHYDSMEECREVAKFILSLSDVKSARCVETVDVGEDTTQ